MKEHAAIMHEAVSALAAQKWASLVQSCCPGVMRTEWHVGSTAVAITAWFTPRDGELGDQAPEVVEIVASPDTVDAYVRAPETARFRADAKFVDFVIVRHLCQSPRHSTSFTETERWPITSDGLGLPSHDITQTRTQMKPWFQR
jgi:hypothetical protein